MLDCKPVPEDHKSAMKTRGCTPLEMHPVARLPEEWRSVLEAQGERGFRAKQVFRWIHARGEFDVDAMSDLSKPLRARLKQLGVAAPLSVERVERSQDGTRKLLLRLEDAGVVECVLIPMTDDPMDADAAAVDEEDGAEEDSSKLGAADLPAKRATLCISTQIGCAMGCVFCASGKAGLKRGLGAAEVVAQVLLAKRYLDPDERLRNLVFMGMGEPLHHYEETARAIRLITHPDGLGMSPRRITVSTVGLVPGIRKLGEDFGGKLGLAISLHAPDNATRDRILPMNRTFNVEQLMTALRAYPLPNRRRITIEYTLIDQVNDSEEHARGLAEALRGLRTKVNLIPLNPIAASELCAPSEERVETFRSILAQARVSCSVRKRRGDDVDAACGQLALKEQGLIRLPTIQEQ